MDRLLLPVLDRTGWFPLHAWPRLHEIPLSCPFLTPAAALVTAQRLLGEAESQAQASRLSTAAAHQELAELARQHELRTAQAHAVQVGLCDGGSDKACSCTALRQGGRPHA